MPTTIAQVEKHDVITNVDPRLGSPLRGIKIKGPHVPVIAGSALIPITDQGNRFVNRAAFGPSMNLAGGILTATEFHRRVCLAFCNNKRRKPGPPGFCLSLG
jgi:hypothetical protein